MSNAANNETFHIYEGPWVNYEKGYLFGSQITLNARNAQILSSFLSIFVTVVGVQLWQIISYIVHQVRAKNGPTDCLHQQTQVILRNANSPWSAAKSFIEQLWSWRKHADRFFTRTLPWALLAVAYATGFGLISIFASSEITVAPGDARLIVPTFCGYYENANTTLAANEAWEQGQLVNEASAAQYAEACYPGNSSASITSCDVFRKPFLAFDSSHADACPFGDNLCITNHTSPLTLDTGLLDSGRDLGINTPDNQHLQYRKLTTCSPINATGHTTIVNITSDDTPYPAVSGDTIILYNLGDTPGETNYTWLYNIHSVISQTGWTVLDDYAYAQSGNGSGFDPIPPLNRTDADIALIGIAGNNIEFQAPCDDPVFGAHEEATTPPDAHGETFTSWTTDRYVGIIACAEQHQICNPNNNQCTSLSGLFTASNEAFNLSLNNMQGATVQRISSTLQWSSIYNGVNGRGASALNAQTKVSSLSQAPLPANQWEVEVRGWFSSGLARIQQEVQQFVTRQSTDDIVLPNTSPVIGKMNNILCNSQLTQFKQGTVSFSLLGLGIILALGFFLVVLGFLIEPITSLFQRRVLHRGIHKHREWVLTEKLQLHRMALEARGVGPWVKKRQSIPITERGTFYEGWHEDDLEDGSYARATNAPSQHTEPEFQDAQEGKPFMSQSDTAYHGHGTPTMNVREY